MNKPIMDGCLFEKHRSAIESLGYRMLGSVVDAQDIAQETYLRWVRSAPEQMQSPKSWLLKTASRLAIDRLRSARRQRESYVGPWLPEPWLVDDASPDRLAELDDTVTIALMLAMERLSPAERAAFLLHEVFALSFEEIAEVLDKSPAACRQLASRARASVRQNRPRFDLNAERHRQLLDAFLSACNAGDLEQLKQLLAEDVAIISDSGGKVSSVRHIVRSQRWVTRFFIGIFAYGRRNEPELRPCWTHINGLPALCLLEGSSVHTAYSLCVAEGKIWMIFVYRNPDKLSYLK